MEYVYSVHTLSGKFLDIVCKTRESAQEECDKLFKKNPSKSYVFYKLELKG